MQLRRSTPTALSAFRWTLMRAIGAISVAALVVVHVVLLPSTTAPDAYKLPQEREIKYRWKTSELNWMQEFAPPQLPKLPISAQKVILEMPVVGNSKGDFDLAKLWKSPSNGNFLQCVEPSSSYLPPLHSRGFLLVHANGGLNQMRAGISDMVAVARLIDATLVIPRLDKRSFWHDSSNFSNVFDEEHFIHALANDVKVVKKIPKELIMTTTAVIHFRSWSGVDYYQNEILPMWDNHLVIKAAKSDSRLANNNLPADIQKLRCRAFFQALRFAPRIEALGKLLVERMRSYGPFIALHLRYEKDMLAFSGCTYGLSPIESDELARIRENVSYWKIKEIVAQDQRAKGYCPLTPKEVAIFISSLGYPPSTPIYIAAGSIYGGSSHLADLESRFPILLSKEKLASAEELEPFKHYASQMAALDYIVSLESDVFIPSYSGNMARAVEGHRRFLGHRKTITPDRKALVCLFDKINRGSLKEGRKLSNIIGEIHKRRQGSPRKRKGPATGTKGMERFRTEEVFYENSQPDCLCQQQP
ncbi:O-fucosyltransferase 7-like [Curcuma longa]|uniref:O-fucosyltransferase 7-like n=1 Tax=Curcuma longa TaxID=136217 RepID=UPI003D9DBC67